MTAGGLIFIGTAADRTFHAYDKDTGKILWERSIEANPEGLVSVFEVNGRQYVAFCASGTEREGEPPQAQNRRLASRQTRSAGLLRIRPAERLKEMMRTVLALLAAAILIGAQQQNPPAADAADAAEIRRMLPRSRTSRSARAVRASARFGWAPPTTTSGSAGTSRFPSAEFNQLTFSEVLPKADTLGVTGIEMTNTQRTSPEVPKPFDYHLQTGERNAVLRRLRNTTRRSWPTASTSLGDEATQRKYFEFAKAVNIPLIVTTADAAGAAGLDKLAEEFGDRCGHREQEGPEGGDCRRPGPRQANRRRRGTRRRAATGTTTA